VRRARPRWVGAALLGVVLALMTASAAVAAPARITVSPRSGGHATTFTLRLRVPESTGTIGSVIRRDVVLIAGPRGSGCLARVQMTMRFARRGTRESIVLGPRQLHGDWCVGTWHGQILQTQTIRCSPQLALVCPQVLLAPRRLGRFSFQVLSASAGGSPPAGGTGSAPTGPGTRAGPTFAGLTSATFCGAMRPLAQPRSSAFTLSWSPATDPTTPSAQIVYEIFMASSPGGEHYAQPTATTGPGATTFTLQEAYSASPPYFVVRARDAAGLTDDNTVERVAVNSCTGAAQ
jgi:hypothetical protein